MLDSKLFISFHLQSYLIDPDFLMNFDIRDEHVKHARDDDLQKKCYPKRAANQTPYQKIEFELRKDAHWPPITHNNITNANTSNHVGGGGVHSSAATQNEKIKSLNESLSRSDSSNQLNRVDSNHHVKSISSNKSNNSKFKLDFEMKSTPNDKLIYEIEDSTANNNNNNDIPIAKQMSPNLNDQFTRI